jgi:rhodanese-related sulfurtransferase
MDFLTSIFGEPVPAVRKLAAAGYTARSLKNGMIAWQRAKLPVNKGN